jgi:RNA polymerase sigma-70 factor (ECF subfamily)
MSESPGPARGDETIVRDARAGDPRALAALVERHMGMVYAIACAHLGDRERAEDLAQEVFLRAFLALDQLGDPGRLAPWLARIARNLAISWLRRDSLTGRLVPLVPFDEQVLHVQDTQSTGARQQMETQERESAVWEAMLKLAPEQRELLLLHFAEDLSANEIGRRLGVHQTTVSRRIQRALAQMRGLLGPVLRDAAPRLRVPGRVTSRTVGLLLAAAAMSAASKAALAAKATQEVSTLAQVPMAAAGAAGLWELVTTSLIAGGKIMATGKGIAGAVAAAALIGGGVYWGTRTQESPPQGETRPVPEVSHGMAEIMPEEGSVEFVPMEHRGVVDVTVLDDSGHDLTNGAASSGDVMHSQQLIINETLSHYPYRFVVTTRSADGSEQTATRFFLSPGRIREERERGGGFPSTQILIWDAVNRPDQYLILDFERRLAIRTTLDEEPVYPIDVLQQMDELRARGATIEVDPATGLPSRVEIRHPNSDARTVYSEFMYNFGVVELLFSMDPPTEGGYRLVEQGGVSPIPTEEGPTE